MISEKMLKDIDVLVADEKHRANMEYPQFHSSHEGIAVLLEEIEETSDELEGISKYFKILWNDIRHDDFMGQDLECEKIKSRARYLAAEALQVAAVCEKFTDMLNKEDK